MEEVLRDDRINRAKLMIKDRLPIESICKYSSLAEKEVEDLIVQIEKEEEQLREKIYKLYTNLEDWLLELVEENRVEKAIVLLIEKQLNIDEISLESGFSVEVVQTLMRIIEEKNEKYFEEHFDYMENWLLELTTLSTYKMKFALSKINLESGSSVEEVVKKQNLPLEIVKKIADKLEKNY